MRGAILHVSHGDADRTLLDSDFLVDDASPLIQYDQWWSDSSRLDDYWSDYTDGTSHTTETYVRRTINILGRVLIHMTRAAPRR